MCAVVASQRKRIRTRSVQLGTAGNTGFPNIIGAVNVQDGCGFNCKDCGFKSSEKTLLGRKVIIEYACGLLPSDSPEYHKKKELFVSFLGTVH